MASPIDLPNSDHVPSTSQAPRWRFRLIVMLVGVVAAAVVARAARGTPEEREQEAAATRSAQPGGGMNLVRGTGPDGQPQTTTPPEERSTLDEVLPYVSEGGIAMILGLLLGMLTRSFLKFLIVLTILGFIGVQYLAHKGVIQIDWGALRDFVLNMVPKGADLSTIVQKKLPSLGAFGLGYLLGLKRG